MQPDPKCARCCAAAPAFPLRPQRRPISDFAKSASLVCAVLLAGIAIVALRIAAVAANF